MSLQELVVTGAGPTDCVLARFDAVPKIELWIAVKTEAEALPLAVVSPEPL